MLQNQELASLIASGALLTNPLSEKHVDVRSVITSRLAQCYESLGRTLQPEATSWPLEDLQYETAFQALHIIGRIQDFLRVDDGNIAPHPSSSSNHEASSGDNIIGTRDLATIRTLLGIVFKWGFEPLLDRVVTAIPTRGAKRDSNSKPIIDLTHVPKDYGVLSSRLKDLFFILLPDGLKGSVSPTHISIVILDRHLPDLLKPCFILGWLPKSLSSESIKPLDDLRPQIIHLLSTLPVHQAVASLISVMPCVSSWAYARKACSFLLSRQLLRRYGLRGTLGALFGDIDELGDQAPLERFEQVSQLLNAVPVGMTPADYYQNIIPQMTEILSAKEIPPVQLRAIAFAISHMLSAEQHVLHHALLAHMILPIFHQPFLVHIHTPTDSQDSIQKPTSALAMLQVVMTNTDPSPALISTLLTPIVPAFFLIYSRLEGMKLADPAVKASVQGLLGTWGRVIGSQEGIAALWLLVEGEGGEWSVDVAGEINLVDPKDKPTPLALFTPEDLERAEEAGEFDLDANLLKLKPDPLHFVKYLKSIDRSDITTELFVRLLEEYRKRKGETEDDPMRTLLYLQLIVQMQSQLSGDDSSTNILKKPDHILAFVKHALDTDTGESASKAPKKQQPRKGLGLEDLRLVDTAEHELDDEADSDDEDTPSSPNPLRDEDMTATALNLLLAVLEANSDLSVQNTPVLDEIFDRVEVLAISGSESVKPLAREARMVMTVRLASTSTPSTTKSQKTSDEITAQETYQKALKLLQDPILPVRAHGLLLLRQLVSPTKASNTLEAPVVDKALVPGILTIFLQSLQDDDSYIFLNAVQGLAAMVDGFGKDTLKGLVEMYSRGLDGLGGTSLTQQDVDTRSRIGEALGQVIRRCGDALPKYADILVPPLFAMVRTSHLPTTLRVSALSLLGLCVNTSPIALLLYVEDLLEAFVDLLRIEAVPISQRPRSSSAPKEPQQDDTMQPPTASAPTGDIQPTATNSKLPPLRRAALHFLSLLTRAFTTHLLESSTVIYNISDATTKRARTTVAYVAAVDEDNVVRVMAKETLQGLDRLSSALVGL